MAQCTSEWIRSGHLSDLSDPSPDDLSNHKNSTPPTLTIYICALVLRSLLETPPLPLAPSAHPLSPLSEFASAKSNLVYSLIDNSDGFFVGTAHKGSRSKMNVTFRLKGGSAVEKLFISKAEEAGIKGVAGHRSVGGELFVPFSLQNWVASLTLDTDRDSNVAIQCRHPASSRVPRSIYEGLSSNSQCSLGSEVVSIPSDFLKVEDILRNLFHLINDDIPGFPPPLGISFVASAQSFSKLLRIKDKPVEFGVVLHRFPAEGG